MTYSSPRRSRSALWEVAPWAAVVIGGVLLISVILWTQRLHAQAQDTVPVQAQVIAYESHGYPVATQNWLRLELTDGVSRGLRLALEVPKGVRPFTAGETITVYQKRGTVSFGDTDEIVLLDPRQIAPPYWIRLALGTFLIGGGILVLIGRNFKTGQSRVPKTGTQT